MTILLGSPNLITYDDFNIGTVATINGRTVPGPVSSTWTATAFESTGDGYVRTIAGAGQSRATLPASSFYGVIGDNSPTSRLGFKLKARFQANGFNQFCGPSITTTFGHVSAGVRLQASGVYQAAFFYRIDSFNSGQQYVDLPRSYPDGYEFDILVWFELTTLHLVIDGVEYIVTSEAGTNAMASTLTRGFMIDDASTTKVAQVTDFQYLYMTASVPSLQNDFSGTPGTLASPDLGYSFYTPNPTTNISSQASISSSNSLSIAQGPGATSGVADPAYYYKSLDGTDCWVEADLLSGATIQYAPVMARIGGPTYGNCFVGVVLTAANSIAFGYYDGTTFTNFTTTSVSYPCRIRLEVKNNVWRMFRKQAADTRFTVIGSSYTIPAATLTANPGLANSTLAGFGYVQNNGFDSIIDNHSIGYLQDMIMVSKATSATNSNLGYTNLGPGRNSEPNWHEDFGNLPGQKIENSFFQKRSGTGTAYDTAGVGLNGSGGLELRQLFTPTLSNNGNAVPSSISFEQSTWAVSGVTKPGKSTVVKQLDGYYDGSLLTFNSTATSYIRTSSNISISNNTTYVFSVYLATETGTASVRLGIGTSSNLSTGTLTDDLIITTTPQRFSFVYTTTASTSLYVGIVNNSSGNAGTIVAWNAQFELGDTPTAVMTTTGAGFTPRPALWTKDVSSSAQYIECDLVNVSGSITISRPMPMALRCVDSANFIGIVLSSSDLRTVNLYVPGQLDQTIGVLPSYPCRLRAEIKLNALQLYYGPSGVRNPSTPFGDTITLGEDLYQDLMVGTETGFGFIPVTSSTTTMTGLFDNYESGSLEEIDIERWNENFDGEIMTPNPSWSNVVFKLTNTTVNQGSQGGSPITGGTLPTSNPTELTFNESVTTNIIRYADTTAYNITAPYSMYFEFYMSSDQGTRSQYPLTKGEGYGIGYAEGGFFIYDCGLAFTSSSGNTAGTTWSQYITPIRSLKVGRWYSAGVMFYNSGGLRCRAYFNGVQQFDRATSQPYNGSNGIAIGNDYANNTSAARYFRGGIRNVYLGQSLFWSV